MINFYNNPLFATRLKFLNRICLSLFAFALFSCSKPKPKQTETVPKKLTTNQIDSVLENFKFDYQKPILLRDSNHLLIPISARTSRSRKSGLKASSSYYNEQPKYWNVLFYNRLTKQSQLLSQSKVNIQNIFAIAETYEAKKKFYPGKILYELRDMDYNNDAMLNSFDPLYLFMSNNDGTELKRISPLNEDLQYFEVLKPNNELIIRTLRDSNKDSTFNHSDETIWYHGKIQGEEINFNEIINENGRKQIERLFVEQWVEKE